MLEGELMGNGVFTSGVVLRVVMFLAGPVFGHRSNAAVREMNTVLPRIIPFSSRSVPEAPAPLSTHRKL